ncbi:MAG: DEAD/DEAH box helicase [Hyphomicrobiales bacterium]
MDKTLTENTDVTFAELGLSKKVLAAVEEAGYTHPTPIQAGSIPPALERRDILGIAQTGTGKTASFTLPMLTLLEKGRARARMPRTLILTPTRELAAQIEENFIKYGKNNKLTVALLIGGVSFEEQNKKLDRGADVLIATPGRLLDHFERGKLLLTGVEVFVIDEADRMLDMGFIPDIERISSLIPFTRQTLFFSATMPKEIQGLADKFLSNPVRVEVARAATTAKTVTQRLVAATGEAWDKREVLRGLISNAEELKNAIIFCNRKKDVSELFRSLDKHGFMAGALHGDMDQFARTAILENFRNGKLPILVASDVAARGLDIPDVSHVFNFDVPFNAEDYVHRIGRTGRAGRLGTAYTLVTQDDERNVADIIDLIKQEIEWHGESVDFEAEREKRPKRGGRGGRGKGRSPRSENSKPASGDKPASKAKVEKNDAESPVKAEQPQKTDAKANEAANPKSADQNTRKKSKRPERSKDGGRNDRSENKVVGMGDHVPDFMTRPIRSRTSA